MSHAKLSASGAHRWIACPGSVAAEAGLADTSSPAAVEGSVAHRLAELALSRGGTAWDYEDMVCDEYPEHRYSREMCAYVQEYIDYVAHIGGLQFYEERVDYSDWVPEGFGTSDVIAIDGTTLHVIDLKYGKGIAVDAEDNPQAKLYAMGALSDYGMIYPIERVVCHIVQPRLDSISAWEATPDALYKWGVFVTDAAMATQQEDAPRNPGEKQCQWCKAKARCPALKEYAERVLLCEFDDIDGAPPANTLSDAQLRAALDAKKLITSWLDAVEKVVSDKLRSGETFPGYKLVSGRSNRAWGDESEAEARLVWLLGENTHSRKLITPPQAEKQLGKKQAGEIADLIVKPDGKPTLAPESDKRPSITIDANDFD